MTDAAPSAPAPEADGSSSIMLASDILPDGVRQRRRTRSVHVYEHDEGARVERDGELVVLTVGRLGERGMLAPRTLLLGAVEAEHLGRRLLEAAAAVRAGGAGDAG